MPSIELTVSMLEIERQRHTTEEIHDQGLDV